MRRPPATLLAALVALLAYLGTLAPGLTSEDAGELVSAAATLGVPHPPGFPLWVLLVRGAIVLSPASAAWTANFMSAVFAAVTIGALIHIGRTLGASVWAAIPAALIVAFGSTFWSQAVIAEVYTLNTALLGLALAAILRWGTTEPGADDRGLRWAALFCGLALTNHHPLTLLAGPAFGTYALLRGGRGLLAPRRLLPVLACVAAPLVLYLYLPWAANHAPPVNWGEPTDLAATWAHISRQAYRGLELSQSVTWADKRAFIRDFLMLWGRELTPWALVVGGALGVASLWRRDRPALLLLGLVLIFDSVVLLAILRFEHEPENVMRVNEYYLPAYVATGALLAVGFEALLGRLSAWPRTGRAIVASLAVAAFALHVQDADMSEHHLTDDFNRHLMASLPPNSIFFPSGDYVSFPCLYLQAVEGLRPDVLLANYTGAPSPQLKAYVRQIAPDVTSDDPEALQAALLRASPRPIVFASKSDVRVSGLQLSPWGLAFRAWRPGARREPGPDPRGEKILRHLERPGAVDDLGQSILADYHRALMEAELAAGEQARALEHLDAATRFSSRSKEGLNNLGSTAAEYGLHDRAIALYRKAAAQSGRYVTPRRNLAMLFDRLGRREEAIDAFETLVRVAPEDTGAKERLETLRRPLTEAEQRVLDFEAATRAEPHRAPLWNNLGTAYVQASRPQDARRAYLEAVRLAPDYAMAHKHLAGLYAEFLEDPVAAARHREIWTRLTASPAAPSPSP